MDNENNEHEDLEEQKESVDLLERWRDGCEEAAAEMFERYVARLVGLARLRISPVLRRRFDAEDIVQSVYRTFFRNAREDRYVLKRSGDLWRLLVGITLNKLHRHIEFHSAGKRSFRREDSFPLTGENVWINAEAVASGPTPSEAIAVLEELDRVILSLTSQQREIFEKRLEGLSIEKIAQDIGRSERTVRRALGKVRIELEEQLKANPD